VELQHGNFNSVINNVIRDNGGDGIHAFDANDNQFGGELSGNTIAGSGSHGIWLLGNGNTIQANGIGGSGQDGVHVNSGQANQVGGAGETLGNNIGSNGRTGIFLSSTT